MTYALTLGPHRNYLNIPQIPQLAIPVDREADAEHIHQLILDSSRAQQSPPPRNTKLAISTAQVAEASRDILSGAAALDGLFYLQTQIGPAGRATHHLDAILAGEHIIYTARIPGTLDGDTVPGVRVARPVSESLPVMSLFGNPHDLDGDLRRHGLDELADITSQLLDVESLFLQAAETVNEWGCAGR